jgi:hypothetical protein
VYARGYRDLFQFRPYVSPGVKKPALGGLGEYLSYLFTQHSFSEKESLQDVLLTPEIDSWTSIPPSYHQGMDDTDLGKV